MRKEKLAEMKKEKERLLETSNKLENELLTRQYETESLLIDLKQVSFSSHLYHYNTEIFHNLDERYDRTSTKAKRRNFVWKAGDI